MRTSGHYQRLLSIFREESDRLRKAASRVNVPETVNYYAHMHLYLCGIWSDIANATLNSHEKDLFLKHVRHCSSEMCALVGRFYMKMHENQKERK